MTDGKNEYEANRRVAGSGGARDEEQAGNDDPLPGITVERGDALALPETGRAAGRTDGTEAASGEGTIGAVGEMDFTGAPAGTSARSGAARGSADSSAGGGPGGGSVTSGGTGGAVAGAGAQSAESTTAALGDRELSTGVAELGGSGGTGGAGGTGGEGGSDAAGESATTGAPSAGSSD